MALIETPRGNAAPWHPERNAGRAFWTQPVAITSAGRDVLEGKRDRVDLLGLDRWLGGHHLTAGRLDWRWDSGAWTLVAA